MLLHSALPLSFAALGVAILLPWNSYITAVDYFSRIFPQAHIDFLFAAIYLTCNLLSILAAMRFMSRMMPALRITYGLVGYLITLSAVPIVEWWRGPSVHGGLSYLIILTVTVAFAGLCDGVMQPAIYSAAVEASPQCVQGVTMGTAASAMLVCALRMVCKAAAGDSFSALRASALLYFFITILYCGICLVLYVRYISGYHRLRMVVEVYEGGEDNDGPVREGPTACVPETGASVATMPKPGGRDARYGCPQAASGAGVAVLEVSERNCTSLHVHSQTPCRQLAAPACTLFFTYCLTLAIFPGFLSEDVQSSQLGSWYPLLLFFTFGVLDFASRLFTLPMGSLQFLSVLRMVVFLPSFAWASKGQLAPAVVFALTGALGATNGVLTNSAFLHASLLAGPEAAECCGNLMVLSLMTGLVVGSFSSWFWVLL